MIYFYSFRVILDDISYERISNETLESLTEFLEELVEEESSLVEADVLYSVSSELFVIVD